MIVVFRHTTNEAITQCSHIAVILLVCNGDRFLTEANQYATIFTSYRRRDGEQQDASA